MDGREKEFEVEKRIKMGIFNCLRFLGIERIAESIDLNANGLVDSLESDREILGSGSIKIRARVGTKESVGNVEIQSPNGFLKLLRNDTNSQELTEVELGYGKYTISLKYNLLKGISSKHILTISSMKKGYILVNSAEDLPSVFQQFFENLNRDNVSAKLNEFIAELVY